jgi:hypothetical protein
MTKVKICDVGTVTINADGIFVDGFTYDFGEEQWDDGIEAALEWAYEKLGQRLAQVKQENEPVPHGFYDLKP